MEWDIMWERYTPKKHKTEQEKTIDLVNRMCISIKRDFVSTSEDMKPKYIPLEDGKKLILLGYDTPEDKDIDVVDCLAVMGKIKKKAVKMK